MKNKVLLLILFCVLLFSCSKENIKQPSYDVIIYFYPRSGGNSFTLIYKNDDPEFSKRVSNGILRAKSAFILFHEKEYLDEGFYKIHLLNEDSDLIYEVVNSNYIYDTQKKIDLKYSIIDDLRALIIE